MARTTKNDPAEAGSSARRNKPHAEIAGIGGVKCITYPNRTPEGRKTRLWTPEKVAAVICGMIINRGGELARAHNDANVQHIRDRIDELVDQCLGGDQDADEEEAQALAVSAVVAETQANFIAQQALQQLTINQKIIGAALVVLGVLVVFPRLFAVLPRALLALVPGTATVAVAAIPTVIRNLNNLRAANDAFFRQVVGR